MVRCVFVVMIAAVALASCSDNSNVPSHEGRNGDNTEIVGYDTITFAGDLNRYMFYGFYTVNASNADERYTIWLEPHVKSLNDTLTMANFWYDHESYLKVGDEQFALTSVLLEADWNRFKSMLTLTGAIVASNGIQYDITIEAEGYESPSIIY